MRYKPRFSAVLALVLLSLFAFSSIAVAQDGKLHKIAWGRLPRNGTYLFKAAKQIMTLNPGQYSLLIQGQPEMKAALLLVVGNKIYKKGFSTAQIPEGSKGGYVVFNLKIRARFALYVMAGGYAGRYTIYAMQGDIRNRLSDGGGTPSPTPTPSPGADQQPGGDDGNPFGK